MFPELSIKLRDAHKFINGVWVTAYTQIPGLIVQATTTNGTSGIGTYKGVRVRWFYNHSSNWFTVTKL